MSTAVPPPQGSGPPSRAAAAPPTEPGPRRRARPAGAWGLLLLLPLLTIVTPLFNHSAPTLAGIPAFYWLQFLGVPLGVLCTIAVYRRTR